MEWASQRRTPAFLPRLKHRAIRTQKRIRRDYLNETGGWTLYRFLDGPHWLKSGDRRWCHDVKMSTHKQPEPQWGWQRSLLFTGQRYLWPPRMQLQTFTDILKLSWCQLSVNAGCNGYFRKKKRPMGRWVTLGTRLHKISTICLHLTK